MRKYSYRVRFAKLGRMRFLSHHDLMRLVERAVRRADLPVAMSEGFNPRPRIAFPLALPLGIESEDEVFEVDLSAWTPPDDLQVRLCAQFPTDVAIRSVDVLQPGTKEEVGEVHYRIEFRSLPPPTPDDLARLLASEHAWVERPNPEGAKRIDVRPYLKELVLDGGRLLVSIFVTSHGTTRPDEVLKALGLSVQEPGEAYVVRKLRTVIVPRQKQKPTRPGGGR
ncbi:MAG: DUF2344 domain-containing protein [Planctomycetes bacterium]|nr:DUF2344 domain-containing protein [Planctomycetota bacterium]